MDKFEDAQKLFFVPLTQGQRACVDAQDYERINQHRWYARWDKSVASFYAARCIRINGKKKTILMHREILNVPDGVIVDHRNAGSTLDNRRSNLREATSQQSTCNRRLFRRSSTGYKGVIQGQKSRRFQARIYVQKQPITLGRFDTPEEAARAYDAAALKYFGEFAQLNFSMERIHA